MLKNTKSNHIILYTCDIDNDKLLINTLNNYKLRVVVVSSIHDISLHIKEDTPKIIFIAAEQFQETLRVYYEALDGIHNATPCEHLIVSLVSRHDEKEAYEAFSAGVIDDYLVSRPLYEAHRPLVICEHLLKRLGLCFTEANGIDFINQNQNYSEYSKAIIAKGLERKEELRNDFEQSISKIDQALDRATEQIIKEQTAKLDLDLLKSTLATIRSDEIRPELLKIQDKALSLLQKIIVNDPSLLTEDTNGTDELEAIDTPKAAPTVNAHLIDTDIPKLKLPPSILIIEDDPVSIHTTTLLFKPYKVNITSAYSGRRALIYLNQQKYDLVLLDISLPDTNGLYLLDQVKKNDSPNTETPFIMLTGDKNKNTVKKAILMGAKGYIIKPMFKSTIIKLFKQHNIPLYLV